MSMLVLSSALSRPVELRYFFVVVIVLLTLVLFWLIEVTMKQRSLKLFTLHERIAKPKSALKWVWYI